MNNNDSQKFVQYSDESRKKILYTSTAPVTDINSKQVQQLISKMQREMQGVGIGLAANQVAVGIQLFMIEFTPDSSDKAHTSRYEVDLPPVPLMVFINPRITAASTEKVSFWHGYLSAHDKPLGQVATYSWLEYEAYDQHGVLQQGRLDKMGAVIFQHEFRHLLGGLYFDYAVNFINPDKFWREVEHGNIQCYQQARDDVPLLLADYNIGETIEQYAARVS